MEVQPPYSRDLAAISRSRGRQGRRRLEGQTMGIDAMSHEQEAFAEGARPSREPDYLRADRGVRSWLLTTDHKRIGLMFYAAVVLMLILGGVFALILRAELLTP